MNSRERLRRRTGEWSGAEQGAEWSVLAPKTRAFHRSGLGSNPGGYKNNIKCGLSLLL